MSNPRGLFAELRRRSVFLVAAAYSVVGWLLVQVSDTVFPRLGLSDWTVTFVIVLAALGLPLAFALAWAYELTPEGIRRDEGPAEAVVGERAAGGEGGRGAPCQAGEEDDRGEWIALHEHRAGAIPVARVGA